MNLMAKQKMMLYLDEDVLRRTAAAAAGSGRDESQVVEDALLVATSASRSIRSGRGMRKSALAPDEALALAYAESP